MIQLFCLQRYARVKHGVIWLAVFSCAGFSDPAWAFPLDRQSLLETIDGLEKNTSVLECASRFREFNTMKTGANSDGLVDFSSPLSPWLARGEPSPVDKHARFFGEPGTGRIYYTRQGTGSAYRTNPSDSPYVWTTKEFGFDGQTRTELGGGKDQPQVGIVSDQPLMINKELSSFEMGMDLFLCTYRGVGLKSYLTGEEVDTTSVHGGMQPDGSLEVCYVEKASQQKHRLRIDPEKGGAVLSEEYFVSGSDTAVIVKTEALWDRAEGGYWKPRSAICVCGARDPRVCTWTFEQVQINHISPTPEMFRVKFPQGTAVSDQRIGIVYVVGAGADKLTEDVLGTLEETLKQNPALGTPPHLSLSTSNEPNTTVGAGADSEALGSTVDTSRSRCLADTHTASRRWWIAGTASAVLLVLGILGRIRWMRQKRSTVL